MNSLVTQQEQLPHKVRSRFWLIDISANGIKYSQKERLADGQQITTEMKLNNMA